MSDYSTLAQRVFSSASGIRGCLMLSRDGMVLGAHPEGEIEFQLKSAWVRFAALGDAERSYVEFPDQTWAFVRRGGYAAFAAADLGVRPGILVDLLEQALIAGEHDRAHDRDTMRVPEAPSAPSGKPRTSLHKSERAPAPSPEPSTATSKGKRGSAEAIPSDDGLAADPPPSDEVGGATEGGAVPAAAEPEPTPDRPGGTGEDEGEVDRILLAKEFAGLLQVPKEDDEASR
jgi:hypothetical protein